METAGNKHVSHESEQRSTNNNTNNNLVMKDLSSVTVCAIVHDFCKAVHQVVMPDYIKLPQGDDLQEVLRGFRQRWGFPKCAGAIDGSSAAGQNDVKVAVHLKKSDTYLIQYHIQCDLCCSHCQKQIGYGSHMSEKIEFRSLATAV